ncbi:MULTISPECIES: Leu/Phe/Val dehydrogenase [unclassified Nocardioides]|uniref:Leu/Phe/Val dehydrogenase n=1 Tax=unclassified Nocardioides TaxID=2615069 RepID=UPI0006F1DE6F|nr:MULTISPECIES: amino acid dehydrogenase [unclassified Nocardioides]KRA30952.1 valine dehydrogenase [Nocardioides sp. Root614]KRA87573.1 valine dehydrogenase [Nocardioides sp. Root682]
MTITAAPADLVFERSDELGTAGHEQVVFCRDQATGLRAIIAIHDTRLGPALGGTRFYPYASEGDALTDVLRLSQGMTHKAAAAGIALGGGKAVIIGDPATVKTPELMRAYGRFVDSLSGRYFTAADVGTTAEDLDEVARTTQYVVGSNGGSGDSGFSTAFGVFCSMKAAAEQRWGAEGLAGRSVGVEGIGKVGTHLVDLLVAEGATVTVTDQSAAAIDRLLARHPGVAVLPSVLDAEVDVYAPCALGATLTPDSVGHLRASIVCGAANNQLSDSSVASLLHDRDITWVPDFVANAGGLIQVGAEIWERTPEHARGQIAAIGETVRDILIRSAATGRRTLDVAAEIVEERLAAAPARGTQEVSA